MMELILSVIPGGWLSAIGAAVVAAVVGVWRIYVAGQKSGRNERKAQEADERAKNLDRIRDAANARPRDDVMSDPRNRDTWK